MKLIVPMAGKGKRMRPHTLTVPKPLIQLAGKPIVERIVESIHSVCGEAITDIGFVIAPDFGKETEISLLRLAERTGARGHIFYQEEALGTAHAVQCAQTLLEGKVLVAFADTLFKASFKMNTEEEGVIWVKEVQDPSAFGVVKTNEKGHISEFIEKPSMPVSKLAIIGIYYFRNAEKLKNEIQLLLDHDIKEKGEYQLTNALENLKNKGMAFRPVIIDEWMDCGNKEITLQTHRRVLELAKESGETLIGKCKQSNSVIIPPCYVGDGVTLENCVVGPYVSVGKNTKIINSVISDAVIGEHTMMNNIILKSSMIGESAHVEGHTQVMSVSAFSVIDSHT